MALGIVPLAAAASTCEATLVAQHSKKPCLAGISFGCSEDSRSIWTKNCRGEFRCGAEAPSFFCGYPPGQDSYRCSCDSHVDTRPPGSQPGDVCAKSAFSGNHVSASPTNWRGTWGAPAGLVFDQSPRCFIHPELQTSQVWLPVTHTSDTWATSTTGVWMYYARGCSRLQWFSGKTFVAFNRLDAAVKLSLNGTCDLACAVRSVAAQWQSDADFRYSNPSRLEGLLPAIRKIATRGQLCRPGQSETDKEIFKFSVPSEPLDPYISQRLRRFGFDSLQLVFQPGGESTLGQHVQTEIWDVRDGEKPTTNVERNRRSGFGMHLRCDGRRCAPRYEGACLVCGDCVDHCPASTRQPQRPFVPLAAAASTCEATLVAQHSKKPCLAGISFGCSEDSRSIWTKNCRGEFRCGAEAPSFFCGYPPGQDSYRCSCDSHGKDTPRGSGPCAYYGKAQDEEARVVSRSMARYADLVVPGLPLGAIDPRFASTPLQYGTNLSTSAIAIIEERKGSGIGNRVHELMNAALLSLTLGLRLGRRWPGAYTCGGLFKSTGLFESLPLLTETRRLCQLECPHRSALLCARAPRPFCKFDRDFGHANFSLRGRRGAEVYHLRQWDAAGKFQSQEAAMSRRADAAAAALFQRAGGPHALYGRIFADFFRFREDEPALAGALAALEQRRAAAAADAGAAGDRRRGRVVTIAAQVRHRSSCQRGHEKVAHVARAIHALVKNRRCEVLLASDRRRTFAALERALGKTTRCAVHAVKRTSNATQTDQIQIEHGVDALATAAADIGLLSRADHLVGSWGSTFTMLIQSLIANRFLRSLRRGAVAHGEPPVVVYCELDGCLRPLPLIANWHVSLQNYPQIDLWVG